MLATVLDRKTGKFPGSGGTLYNRWHADIASAADYYPGGMIMPGRYRDTTWSRMGSQSQEKDDEIYGKGNVYAFKYRLEDARINRFFSVDPLTRKYSHLSPYQFGDNAYIGATELEGAEANWLWNSTGYRPDTNPDEFMEDLGTALKDPNTHLRAALFVGQLLPWIGFAALTEGAGSMVMGEMAIAGEARLMRTPLRIPSSAAVESPALSAPTAELSVTTAAEVPKIHGTGNASGVIEISSRTKSTGAFKNWSSSGGVEYVFDIETNSFAMGKTSEGVGSPHQRLVRSLGSQGGDNIMGGTVSRDNTGVFRFTENSGHFGENWQPQFRKQFSDFLKKQGIKYDLGGYQPELYQQTAPAKTTTP